MKSISKILLLSFLAIFFLTGSNIAAAYTIDGDVSDWGIDLSSAVSATYLDTNLPIGGNDIDYETEDNTDQASGWVEVGPGWSNGNLYDVEAIYFDNDDLYGYIAIISGLPMTGAEYAPGDIGISVVGSSTADPDLVDQGGVSYTPAKTAIYEYGISMDGNLQDVAQWESVHYDGSPDPNFTEADPWAIYQGTVMKSIEFSYSTIAVNSHYVIETRFLLADLGLSAGSELQLHWAVECGNDYLSLNADVNPVPEPATMLLLGSGLIGMMGIGRKRFKK